ncbi:MAG TPA: AbrB/MazE/SpoVT family DNA-binding domain-containing protein [Thermoanaerobaculia bacterium]|nr:AbrB/MazE/SpoVT family DNA-binding domain-containing protein [Thermoanaerobaculia bacterium]
MNAKIQKWGNSLGLRIPKPFAEEVGLRDKAEVELRLVEGALVVRPLQKPTYRLDDLLSRVTSRNRHEAVSEGGPVGREAW